MTEEYYSKNIFGERVDINLSADEEMLPGANVATKEFNIFALTDAIGMRDKKNAWLIYERALASGMVADEIFYRIMWGVKSLIITAKTKDAEEAGLNPFVYKKSKSFLQNWKVEELEKLSEDLTIGFHKARRGIFNLENFLEKTILSI